MDGYYLLVWAITIPVLVLLVRFAYWIDTAPTAVERYCAAVDQELDETDAFYADLNRTVRI